MLVRSANMKLDDIFIDHLTDFDMKDLSSEFVLSDDIWNKFELPFDSATENQEWEKESSLFSNFNIDISDLCEIRNHDCMWAGHCGSKEHPVDEFKPIRPLIIPGSIQQVTTSPKTQTGTGRSLLLKAQTNVQQTIPITSTHLQTNKPNPNQINLESPPSSDDEESKGKTLLQLLQDAISECDLDDEADLQEYLEENNLLDPVEEENEEEEVDVKPVISKIQIQQNTVAQFTSDHCYHKDKNATMRMNNLGIETPSDSEEEIDVVSVGEKQTLPARMVYALPNNPSNRDRQALQRTMASAITKNGIKTLPPRKPAIEQTSPTKRRAVDHRGIKRSKHRTTLTSPYKRRSAYNHSSDSEPEPSEKRNLHNNMERQRRIDLRNAFEDLRSLVPEVSKRERAPKVVILREAALYCDQLGDTSENMERQVEELRRQQKRLRARVSYLRLSLAAKHR